MFPPGAPPSWSSTGSICRYWYAGPPAAWMAATRRVQLVVASTTVLPVPPVTPSLSCTSSIPITSGARRFVTMSDARWSYFACGSLPARFSTLNVAKVTSFCFTGSVTSRGFPPAVNVGVVSAWIL